MDRVSAHANRRQFQAGAVAGPVLPGGGVPSVDLVQKIEPDFITFDNLSTEFRKAAATQFGCEWAWLVLDGDVSKTGKTAGKDASPANGRRPLLTIDVWEQSYYLEYRNPRSDYIADRLDHIETWNLAEENYTAAAD